MGYSRTRNRTNSSSTQSVVQTDSAGANFVAGTWPYSDAESITDVVTPMYHRKIQDGVIINNPCLYNRTVVSNSGSGSYKATYTANGYWFAHNGAVTRSRIEGTSFTGLSSTVSDGEKALALDTVKQQAIANIAKSPWSFGEDVGEVRETLKYLKNPAASLAEVSKSFERKARNLYYRYGNRAKALSGAWASYRFAMLPLQRSLEDIVESSFVRNQKEFQKGQRLSARSQTVLRGSNSTSKAVGYQDYNLTRTDEITYKASILYQILSDLKGWQYRYGLRLRDFPQTAWQLVPYSFMVDRVANVSNCIGGLTNLSDPNLVILAACVTTKEKIDKSFLFTRDRSPGWSVTQNCETVKIFTFQYKRDTWTPTVSDTIPHPDLGGLVKDATSVIDLLALVTQRLKVFR